MDVLSSFQKLPREKKTGVVVACIILIYAFFGFVLAPPILKSFLISNIKQNFNRDAHLERLRVNPFTLSLTAKSFEIYDIGEEQFAGFQELYLNFQVSSIFRGAYTFKNVRLLSPHMALRVSPGGELNLSDLLNTSDNNKVSETEENGLPQVLIFNFSIDEGRFDFVDHSRPIPFAKALYPIKISLNDFSTRRDSDSPYAFTASTGKGEALSWEGDFSVNPLRSKGQFSLTNIKARTLWEYIQHQVNFEVRDGFVDLAGKYKADIGGETYHLMFTGGALDLHNLKIGEQGKDEVLISAPKFSVRGAHMGFNKKEAAIALVESSGARYKSWITKTGEINHQSIFGVAGEIEEGVAPLGGEREPKDQVSEWIVRIDEVHFSEYGIDFEDRRFDEPVQINLEPININLKDVSNEKDSKLHMALDAKINQTGTFAVNGKAETTLAFADLEVKASDIVLKPFQQYIDSVARLDILNGVANLKGRLKYGGADEGAPKGRYEGVASIVDFEAVDRSQSDDFLKWESLALEGIVADLEPNRLTIQDINAKGPYARVIIWPDSTVNLAKIISRQTEKEDKSDSSEKAPTMSVEIKAINIEDGSANFADHSLTPNFAAGIHDLTGSINGLSSESLARADVSLEGKVDEYAPVKIFGQINPLAEDVYTDLELSFKNIELTTFTPYSGKFAGYKVEKGKLSLDLKYQVSENMLIGENRIVLDQLTLGERVESPNATKLPVGLAVALLRDQNGVIDVDLPIRGDLNDPEFSYGHLVTQAILNLITKAITSPFALLGGLVGTGGEELSFIEFTFGSAELETVETDKLDKLAVALSERPALALEIKPIADAEHDKIGLAERKLLNQMEQLKRQESGIPDDQEVVLSDEDYVRLIVQVYIETFDEDPRLLLEHPAEETVIEEETSEEAAPPADVPPDRGMGPAGVVLNVSQQFVGNMQSLLGLGSGASTKSKVVLRDVGRFPESTQLLVERARQRLIDNTPIGEIDLRLLAQERANRIKGHLIEEGGIPNERVFILELELGAITDSDTMRINLTLSGK